MARVELRLAFLLSGTGRTLVNLARELESVPGLARIVTVIASRAHVLGLDRARELGIPSVVLPCKTPRDSTPIFKHLESCKVDYALLGGWLRLLEIPPAWERRVLNIHPALLPKFGGRGYYGRHVHEAVLSAGERESGCTVHFVDNEYDHGPVLLAERVPVFAHDTPDTLADRVFQAECRAYPRAVKLLAEGNAR
ncbi:MAG: phosphoribosylglycinamide formyltransferase [Planctomycetota bacterium]